MDALLSLAVRLNLYSYYSIFAEKILGVFSNIFTTFPLKTQWFSTKTGKNRERTQQSAVL
jgi:methionine salvage enolase-phosphatase E1